MKQILTSFWKLTLSILGKIIADDILQYFFIFFPKKVGIGISCKLSPTTLFSRGEKDIVNYWSAEFAQVVVIVEVTGPQL